MFGRNKKARDAQNKAESTRNCSGKSSSSTKGCSSRSGKSSRCSSSNND